MSAKRHEDPQQNRLYQAEWAIRAHYGTGDMDPNKQMWTWESLTGLAKESWKRRDVGNQPLPQLGINSRLKSTSRFRYTYARPDRKRYFSQIQMAKTMLCPLVLLHELTHAEMVLDLLQGNVEPHGPVFAMKNIVGVTKVLGPTLGKRMLATYLGHGIRVADPVSYTISNTSRRTPKEN